jgi:phospholipid/cholesterol/gamma-HCH transport system substrate-binding protein
VTAAVIQLQTTAESLERLLNDLQTSGVMGAVTRKSDEVEVPQ